MNETHKMKIIGNKKVCKIGKKLQNSCLFWIIAFLFIPIAAKTKPLSKWTVFKNIDTKKTFSIVDKSSFRANLNATRFFEKKLLDHGFNVILQPEPLAFTPQAIQEKRRKEKEVREVEEEVEEQEIPIAEEALNQSSDLPKDTESTPVLTTKKKNPKKAAYKQEISITPTPEIVRPQTDYTFEITYKLYESKKDYAVIDATSAEREMSLLSPVASRFLCEQFIAHLFNKEKETVAIFAFEAEWIPKDLTKILPFLITQLQNSPQTNVDHLNKPIQVKTSLKKEKRKKKERNQNISAPIVPEKTNEN